MIQEKITKVDEALIGVQKDVREILTNHLPHMNKKLNWLFLAIVISAIIGLL